MSEHDITIRDLDNLEQEIRGNLRCGKGEFCRRFNRRIRLMIKMLDDLREDVFEESQKTNP